MIQRRQKKQLTILDNVSSLTDHELREALKKYEQAPGPITDSTRTLYRKKLASLMVESEGKNDDDDDDTSDEDYVQDEEEEDDEDSESRDSGDDDEEEDEIDDDEEQELVDELDDKLTSTTGASSLNRSAIGVTDASPNRISKSILFVSVSFFMAIFSFYIYSKNDYKLLVSQPFKHMTKQLLVLLALSPIGYIIYRIVRYYRHRYHQEMKRVSDLVDEALELLQSPDNPKGLMPILHIRDTLLTPAERKTKKMINTWSKAVKFIEENESRVKVELVNIDGEDFRAWKWIGIKKL